MKKRLIHNQVFILLYLLLITACNRSPQVFSFNNFATELSDSSTVEKVTLFPVKDIEGDWSGLDHRIKISFYSTIKGMDAYTAELIDTAEDKSGNIDTTSYYLVFITIAGHPFAEVLSEGTKPASHDFTVPVSTYLKINKLSPDTIIVQMPSGVFAAAYMKDNHYNYFVPYSDKNEKVYPVYITEEPDRLAELLNGLCNFPKAFLPADTIVKKH